MILFFVIHQFSSISPAISETSSLQPPEYWIVVVVSLALVGLLVVDPVSSNMATLSTTTQHEVSNPSQLPTFVFPARASPSSAPASLSKATGRRPMSIPAQLPSFSFNPSTTTSTLSPPISPCFANFDLSNSPRAAGHRRGTSEFIGGDGKVGSSAGLMSKSPQGDNALPPLIREDVACTSTLRRGIST
ncbi:hypothetical protein DID88_007598 [Monilinia fructigena]|uniref:Uncharacterized protein n=1 Tax=Monilinia fructigena TaxID=38457 RepID=A0A395J2T3_9HELO|nr:hypothetical protein DID88_007598 [Monilinia fructigena]